MTTTLVYGLAIAGRAVASELVSRGEKVILVDDLDSSSHSEFARSLNSEIRIRPTSAELAELLQQSDRVVPAPGVPETHELFEVSRQMQKPVMSEIELAYQIEQKSSSPRPMVAVTGTDGKTTTTLMAAAILNSAGKRSLAVGNTETPLIAALRSDAQAFSVECSSFRLALTQTFRAKASVWLNFAPDHLDWHSSLNSYHEAKAKIWSHLMSSDVAVVPMHDQAITKVAKSSGARVVSFGADSGDYHVLNGVLTCPSGEILHRSEMARSLPHDVTNALAAAAITIEAGLSKKVKAVVAIGSSAKEIAAAFSGECEVQIAGSMRDAVNFASKLATAGDVVLLSPGCASYDWYKNYGERGADFKNEVSALIKNKQIKN